MKTLLKNYLFYLRLIKRLVLRPRLVLDVISFYTELTRSLISKTELYNFDNSFESTLAAKSLTFLFSSKYVLDSNELKPLAIRNNFPTKISKYKK